MWKSVIGKGVLVLVVVLICAVPGIGYAEGEPPDGSAWDTGSITLQNGEVLDADEVNHLKFLLRIYKENDMKREADIVERMLAGQLSASEVQQMTDSQTRGFPGYIDDDSHYVAYNHMLWTVVSRHWWQFGKNGHSGWSHNPITGADWPIDEIWMTADAWDSSWVPAYYNSFGFTPGSKVYCSIPGPSSGYARSSVFYEDGGSSYTGVAEGSY